MTSRQDEIDPRYDPAYQRGGGELRLSRSTEEPPAIVEISDALPPAQPKAPQVTSPQLERHQRKYRIAAWVLAAGLVAMGVFCLFADNIFPAEVTSVPPNWSGYPVEPWTQKLRWAAPNLIMLGILTAAVQVFIEQLQAFRLRIGR
ncbi:hypothetical protein ITX31_10925 [Arthrobacter gandavensis]|uniref:hypothetical protein n=1 Tax=Arthrobacter gandavensis TaxID=169960 RepID=UPI00188EBF46|nr:hypothetical protein [Arthrobacter gandavensis]MBF4994622.1 hypothetical protein [Arthrobacter gandavensis]